MYLRKEARLREIKRVGGLLESGKELTNESKVLKPRIKGFQVCLRGRRPFHVMLAKSKWC